MVRGGIGWVLWLGSGCPALGELLGGGLCIHSKRNSERRARGVVCRVVSGLGWVGDSREESPGAPSATRVLNKGSSMLAVTP